MLESRLPTIRACHEIVLLYPLPPCVALSQHSDPPRLILCLTTVLVVKNLKWHGYDLAKRSGKVSWKMVLRC